MHLITQAHETHVHAQPAPAAIEQQHAARSPHLVAATACGVPGPAAALAVCATLLCTSAAPPPPPATAHHHHHQPLALCSPPCGTQHGPDACIRTLDNRMQCQKAEASCRLHGVQPGGDLPISSDATSHDTCCVLPFQEQTVAALAAALMDHNLCTSTPPRCCPLR